MTAMLPDHPLSCPQAQLLTHMADFYRDRADAACDTLAHLSPSSPEFAHRYLRAQTEMMLFTQLAVELEAALEQIETLI